MLTKLILFISILSLGKIGTDTEKFKAAITDIKNDYKSAGEVVKRYVSGDTSGDVMNEVNAINNDINALLNSFDYKKVENTVKEKFIIISDFIFNGTSIKGVTFEHLTEVEKEIVQDIYNKLDEKIKSKYPNYKEVITEKVEQVKQTGEDLKEYAKEKTIEAIGSENFNNTKEKVIETKDKIVDKTKETYNKAKDKVTTWYDNLKNKK